jgi:predicted negative regulator of RcsB-dependent stress response
MPLDLEEQEQLDQLKAFWQKYRNLITGVVTAALFAYAAYSGYQWWRTSQAAAASQLYETMITAIGKVRVIKTKPCALQMICKSNFLARHTQQCPA